MSYKFSRRFPYLKKKKSSGAVNEDQLVQRVIIPQGLIHPHEVTIIEIPDNLQYTSEVIAKPKVGDDSFSDFSPAACSSFRHSYIFPKDSNASASLGASQYTASTNSSCGMPLPVQTRSATRATCPPIGMNIAAKSKSFPRTGYPRMDEMYETGYSYGGYPQDFSPNRSGSFYKEYVEPRNPAGRPLGMNIETKSRTFPRTGYPRMDEMYESGYSYGGYPQDYSGNRSGSFYKQYIEPNKPADRPIGMNIDAKSRTFPRTDYPRMDEMYESGYSYGGYPQDFSPNQSGSFYKQYIEPNKPSGCPIGMNIQTKAKSFPRTGYPQMAEMYESGVSYGGYPQDFSPNRSGTFYKDYIQDRTSIIGPHNESDEPGFDYSCPVRRARGFDPLVHGEALKQFSPYKEFEPLTCSTPKGYVQSVDSYLNAMDYTIPEPCLPSFDVPAQPAIPYKRPRKSTKSALKRVLDNLDLVELSRIQNDLRNFQSARRKLLFDASALQH